MATVNDPKAAQDPAVQSTYDDLKVLHDVCVTCVRCDLAQTRTQVVFGDGQYLTGGQIKVMGFGEAPGEDEDVKGRPFVGRSGRLLDSMLKEGGLPRETIWLTNTNKCRPTLIEGNKVKNRAPNTKEQKACEIWWRNEVSLIKPRLIVCFGATAAKAVLGDKNFMITKDRGQWLSGPEDTEVLVTFHPSYVLRQFGDALNSVKETVVGDIRKVKERLEAIEAGNAAPQSWQKPQESDDSGQQLSMF